MNATEEAEIVELLARLWPRAFTVEERDDFARRVNRYSVFDVRKAIDGHKNVSKFAPKVSEILAQLRGKVEQGAPADEKTPSWVQCVRDAAARWNSAAQSMADDEIIFRYHRCIWIKYRAKDSEILNRCSDQVREVIQSALQRRLASLKRECAVALMTECATPQEDAERLSDWIDCQQHEIAQLFSTFNAQDPFGGSADVI